MKTDRYVIRNAKGKFLASYKATSEEKALKMFNAIIAPFIVEIDTGDYEI